MMQNNWQDNELQKNSVNYSKSKKPLQNRIEVISKVPSSVPMPVDRFTFSPLQQSQHPSHSHSHMNHTHSHSRGDSTSMPQKVTLRRVNTADMSNQKQQQNRNVMRLMQEQLEFVRNQYEEKIKNGSEIYQLRAKLQANAESISRKDLIIQLLKNASIGKSVNESFSIKFQDIQTKFASLINNQNKLGKKMNEITNKVQLVEKGLLSLLACKMANMQTKLSDYVQKCTQRINIIQINKLNALKNQPPMSPESSKTIIPRQVNTNLQSLMGWVQALRDQVIIFKEKDFRYENENIANLKKDVSMLKIYVGDLQKKFSSFQNSLKESRASSRKNNSPFRGKSWNGTVFFDDYDENVYENTQNFDEDEDCFFHPQTEQKSQSGKISTNINDNSTKWPDIQMNPNQSFENFTSEEEDQSNFQIKRLIWALDEGGYKLPLAIDVDLNGFIIKKIDKTFLLDRNKMKIKLNNDELHLCRKKQLLIW